MISLHDLFILFPCGDKVFWYFEANHDYLCFMYSFLTRLRLHISYLKVFFCVFLFMWHLQFIRSQCADLSLKLRCIGKTIMWKTSIWQHRVVISNTLNVRKTNFVNIEELKAEFARSIWSFFCFKIFIGRESSSYSKKPGTEKMVEAMDHIKSRGTSDVCFVCKRTSNNRSFCCTKWGLRVHVIRNSTVLFDSDIFSCCKRWVNLPFLNVSFRIDDRGDTESSLLEDDLPLIPYKRRGSYSRIKACILDI